MKKNVFYAITVIASVFAMVSCEMNSFQNTVEVIGDYVFYKDKIIVKDTTVFIYVTDSLDSNPDTVLVEKTDTVLLNGETIYIYDTVYVEGGLRIDTITKTVYDTVFETIYDTVTVTKDLFFECYGFDANGNLVATTSKGDKALFSYHLSMTTSGDVYFKEEGTETFVFENNDSYFEDNKASFTVRRGTEEMTLTVFAAGASSVIMNDEEVTPCQDFSIKAELKNLNDREINGRPYQTAVVKYYFYNAQGKIIASAEQYVFAPKADVIVFDNQRVAVANRTITFDSHEEPLIYDCVLTDANDGSHYYHYRQVVNNVPQEWKQVKLTADEYNFIADRSSVHGTYALAIHYRKEYSGPAVGKLGDNIAGADEVAYFAPNRTKNTVKGSRFAVFGRLNTAIAGTGVKENGLIKMTTTVVTFAGETISSAGTIYFY